MSNDLTVTVEKQVVETEQVGVTLKELSLNTATPTTPAVLALVLAPRDAQGEWRTDVQPILVRRADKLEADRDDEGNEIPIPPQERHAASAILKLMFEAVAPDTPENQMMGVVGLSVWEAAKKLLGQELSSGQ